MTLYKSRIMLETLVIAVFLAGAGFSSVASGADSEQTAVPLPRPRPSVAAVQSPADEVIQDDDGGEAGRAFIGCQAALSLRGVEFVVEKPLQNAKGCQVPDAVRVFGIASGGGMIRLPGQPVLNCKFSLRLATWLADVAAPVVNSLAQSPLTALTTGPGYVCRNRNNKKTGKISEHGFGNAIDITGFQLANRKKIQVSALPDGSPQQVRMLMALRVSSCGFFTTVLGPGANEAHRAHFHFDYGKHGRTWNYRICE